MVSLACSSAVAFILGCTLASSGKLFKNAEAWAWADGMNVNLRHGVCVQALPEPLGVFITEPKPRATREQLGETSIASPQGSSRGSGDGAGTRRFKSQNKIFKSNFSACARPRSQGTWRAMLSWREGQEDEAETPGVVTVKALKSTGPRLLLLLHYVIPSPYFACNGFQFSSPVLIAHV